ncbi:winged helix-turn-helix domain-containing protein [Nitrococcus mobilis]|uniref:Putative two-component system response regulator n=1 Tax=Nitrococcus mobilis Nb-231 TaxID=314278 RepID=A4BNB3_9GAMM|nr:winged helix-turn-helix domain-containing protein [Nitrococcus mobilis]EAR22712.1 putative two-component system response regulator [Nitrococcus mobilis Nb-231]
MARRPKQAQPPLLELGALRIDQRAHRALAHGQVIPLTPREFALLSLLARHRGRVFTRNEILERTAGSDSESSERSVEALVFGLRRKLAAASLDGLVQTRRGIGYLIP